MRCHPLWPQSCLPGHSNLGTRGQNTASPHALRAAGKREQQAPATESDPIIPAQQRCSQGVRLSSEASEKASEARLRQVCWHQLNSPSKLASRPWILPSRLCMPSVSNFPTSIAIPLSCPVCLFWTSDRPPQYQMFSHGQLLASICSGR
jgi:hypothetical protein